MTFLLIYSKKNNDCGFGELSLLAASPEDGDPPGLSLAEVPGLLGPMVPRVHTKPS